LGKNQNLAPKNIQSHTDMTTRKFNAATRTTWYTGMASAPTTWPSKWL